MAGCPDPSELDALVAGRLDGAVRQRVESHLDACRECAGVVGTMMRMFSPGELPFAATAVGSNPLEQADGAVPMMVGRYRLGEKIGAGAMGVVFMAHDPELDRTVAVKLLHPGVEGDLEVQRARMMREAQAMAKLSHPNVVAVFDVGRIGDQLFLAMELVDGVTLTRWMGDQSRSRGEVVGMFRQAGQGLAAAHAVGLVHRDFKPDNVLVGKDGRPRVTDFGLARPLAVEDRSNLAQAFHLPASATATGALVGTPAYMAPEQLRAEPATAQSDQFAFCVALYEALFGVRPFDGKTVFAIAENVLVGRMRDIPARTPRWLRGLLVRGLSLAPEARFSAMTALLDELGRDHGRARRIALAVGAMAAGAAVIVTALQFAMKAPTERAAAMTDRAVQVAADAGAVKATPVTQAAPSAPAVQQESAPSVQQEPAPAVAKAPARPAVSRKRIGVADGARGAQRFPRSAAIASIDAFCRIPYDVAHPDPTLAQPIMDWGKVTKVGHEVATIGGGEVDIEVIEIAGQRATYRTENDFGPLGSLAARKGDLVALCSQGDDNLHQLASGPLIKTHLIVPLSAPPRLGELARFAPRHIAALRVPRAVERGELGTGRYLVYAEIGSADGDQFAVERDSWRISGAQDALGAERIAPGKRVWLVVGDPVESGGKRPVLRVYAAMADLFP